MIIESVINELEALADPVNVAGMARFGITAGNAYGVAVPKLKEIAKRVKREADDRHAAALALWESGSHEARIIAALVDDPKRVTVEQMELWVRDFDNWAVCDSTCGHLFCRTPIAYEKAYEWSARDAEFQKRAGIVLVAWLAVHDKKAPDDRIDAFLPLLEEHASDERNFIKKAVNWSLRQIGKRSLALNARAVECAERIRAQGSKPARWIASDAIRELTNEKTLEMIRAREQRRKS